MELLEPHLQTLDVPVNGYEFWLERPSGFPLPIVTNLDSEHAFAYHMGMRNGAIVFRINDCPTSELSIGEILLILVGEDHCHEIRNEIAESLKVNVRIEWLSPEHSSLALAAVHELRYSQMHPNSESSNIAVSSSSVDWTSEQQRSHHNRQRNLLSNMTDAQVQNHRRRNTHANMTDAQIRRHRQRNIHANMTEAQVLSHRRRNSHANMTDVQIAHHRERAVQIVLPREGAIHLNYGTRCPHCGFRYLTGETSRNLCCGRGKAIAPSFPALAPLSPNIRRLAMEYPKHFAEQSFQYNNLVAFAIIGVDNGDPNSSGFERPVGGPHCIKIHGRTYHRVLAADRQRNAVRYFVYDALDELRQHGLERNLNDTFLQLIHDDLMRINPFARDLRQLGRELAAYNSDGDSYDHHDGQHRRRRGPPTALRLVARTNTREIGAVIVHGQGDCRQHPTARPSIMIHLHGEAKPQYLRNNDPLREPLAYPLLFPFGDLGWGQDHTYDCEHAEYLRYRMLMPEAGLELRTQSKQLYNFNRFQLLSRIAQVYLVDTISRIEDNRLNYIRCHQATFLGDDHDGVATDAEDHEGVEVESKSNDYYHPKRLFLPSSYTGSARHLKKLAANALALVAAKGKPTVFITLTCNPRWPEIVRELVDGQTAFDRPDITCRVFHTKLQLILKLIRQGEIFGAEHPVEYEMRVIEFQFRGLPHAHVVMRLGGLLNEGDATEQAAWIDRHITACAPTGPGVADGPEEDREYAELVKRHMTHVCSRGPNGCLSDSGTCGKGFPKPLTDVTHFDQRGYPVYRRPTPDACNVVPHNRLLLRLWDGHVNVEFAGYVFLVLYLYKYIFKGPDRARVEVHEGYDEEARDEIKRYVHARYLSSMECMWTTLRYHTYPATSPPVKCVVVQLPSQLPPRNQVSDMQRYFHRPSELHHLRYTELFARYVVDSSLPNYATIAGYERYSSVIKGVEYHYVRRRAEEFIVCRMNTIYITAGEVWYLRLILLNKAVISHIDARTLRGHVYPTFQEAAKAAGYATDENEAWLCFTSTMQDSTPAQLRGLFVLLTREGYPTIRIYRDDAALDALMADFLERENSHALAINRLLEDLADRLQECSGNCKLSDYGLPEPDDLASELSRESLRFDPDEQRDWIERQSAPSQEQQAVQDAVIHAFESKKRLLLFVQGKGGTGKTWLMKRILAEVRARHGLALVCAATGLAATLYSGGTTAHSLFKVPVEDDAEIDEEHELTCNLPEGSQRLELLAAARLIVWDEFPNNHRHCFEAIYRAMKGFQHQILVACGDFRQIPPVVQRGDKWAILDASIGSSHLWRHFHTMELTVSHRHALDPQYSAFVQQIGEGTVGEDLGVLDEDGTSLPNAKVIPLQLLRAFSPRTLDEAIDFVYPDLTNAASLSDRAILAATNDLVDEWNTIIQHKRCAHAAVAEGAHRNADEIIHLLSADVLTECDDEHGHIRRMLTTEYLNQLNRPGVPPHDLQLAVGDICIVMRNLQKKDGLTNNRRVLVLDIKPFAVRVQTIGTNPKVFTLPRIRFKFRLPQGSFEVMRTQFPLRLAYCMTYNKSQGQELHAVLVDLRRPAFTHGHLYVALSRVRRREAIAAFISDADIQFDAEGRTIPYTINIVYPELLQCSSDSRRQQESAPPTQRRRCGDVST